MESLKELRKRANRARNFPVNTCPASRHLHLMAEALASGKPYPMLQEEPEHCAESILAVVAALWEARSREAGAEGAPPKHVVIGPMHYTASKTMWTKPTSEGGRDE